MTTLGDYITWAMFAGGAFALARIAWRRYGSYLHQLLLSVSIVSPRDYVTHSEDDALSDPVCPRTDAPPDGRTELQQPVVKPATLDTARSLRAHGYSRDEARAFLKTLGYTLGNDIWAAAKPPILSDDDALVTPYAGRVTKRSYYPDTPDLEYQEP